MSASFYYVVLTICIVCSAFFSASETAFSSVNLIRLRQYAENGRAGAKKALHIAERFDDVLLAILIGNNIVNLGAASLATILATSVLELGATGVTAISALMTVLIIIFGEILPKSYAKEHAESLALKVGFIYYVILKVFKPLIWAFSGLKKMLTALYQSPKTEPSVTEDELNVIIDTMEEEGVLHEDEVTMLQRVLDLSETFVKDIMTPRLDMICLDSEASDELIKQTFLEEKYSRIPVYQENADQIIGVLYEREWLTTLLESDDQTLSIASLLHEPIFVSSTMRVSDLLTRLQNEKQHLAIVIDEYGGTAGLVTLEDVLEELVGEIYDEHDDVEEEPFFTELSEGVFEFKAELSLSDVFEQFEDLLPPPTDHYSLGSWLYSKLEDIPCVGDLYVAHYLLFTVSAVEERRIKKVRVERQPQIFDQEEE